MYQPDYYSSLPPLRSFASRMASSLPYDSNGYDPSPASWSSNTSNRACLDCGGPISAGEPDWKVRCLDCFRVRKQREKEAFGGPAADALSAAYEPSSTRKKRTNGGSELSSRQRKQLRDAPPDGGQPVVSGDAGGQSVNLLKSTTSNPSRFWLGTYFPSDLEQEEYAACGTIPPLRLDYQREDIQCWRGQWEFGGSTDKQGKLHVQFAVAYRDQVRSTQARRIIGGQYGHFQQFLEPAYSAGIWDYVTKVETRVQQIDGYGNLTDGQGNRSDLDILYQEISNGMPLWEVMSRYPRQYLRNHAAVAKLCGMYDKPRVYGDINVEIWWGVTGSGKSHRAFTKYPDAYRKCIPGKWWEGYKGEDTVIFEEFNPEEDKELRLPELLKILDKYPYQVEIKGASIQLKARTFIFTTNIDPRTWYQGHPQVPAFCRRVSKVCEFRFSWADQQEHGLSAEEAVLVHEGLRPVTA